MAAAYAVSKIVRFKGRHSEEGFLKMLKLIVQRILRSE